MNDNQQLIALVKLEKKMKTLIDNYLAADRADTAKFMAKRTRLENQIRELKNEIALPPEPYERDCGQSGEYPTIVPGDDRVEE